MLSPGDPAPSFALPAVVTVLAISGDSVYSHRAFAAEYDLQLPLLADVHGEVAEEYGVATESPDAGYRTERAVIVVGPSGRVEYAWRTDDPTQPPEIEVIQSSVDGIGDTDAARARYRLAHAHYTEGRRTFTSAMHALEQEEWVLAQHDFSRAHDEFATARNQVSAAARFAEDTVAIAHYDRAEDKTEALWRATEWLAEAASEYASGNAMLADRLRGDAESPLEEARAIDEPPEPDDFPLEEPPTGMSSDEPDGPSLTLEENPEMATEPEEHSGEIEADVDDAELQAITSEIEDENGGSASEAVDVDYDDNGGYDDWDWDRTGDDGDDASEG